MSRQIIVTLADSSAFQSEPKNIVCITSISAPVPEIAYYALSLPTPIGEKRRKHHSCVETPIFWRIQIAHLIVRYIRTRLDAGEPSCREVEIVKSPCRRSISHKKPPLLSIKDTCFCTSANRRFEPKLGLLTRRDVGCRADKIDLTEFVLHRSYDDLNVLDRSVRHDEPVFDIELFAMVRRYLNKVLYQLPLLGVCSRVDQVRRELRIRINLVDSVCFFDQNISWLTVFRL